MSVTGFNLRRRLEAAKAEKEKVPEIVEEKPKKGRPKKEEVTDEESV